MEFGAAATHGGGLKMGRKVWVSLATIGFGLFSATCAQAGENEWGHYQVGEKRSGYTYAEPETRAMQDDSFENPHGR